MATDVLLSRELKLLQDELATAKMQRSASNERAAAEPPTIAPTAAAEPSAKASDELELQSYLRQLADEVTELFGEAEKGISAHPTQSVAGALLVGVLIGRLLGRR
jgi:ElaB/YqjD/DUF883 family membrane-anchored ribosome-binding protein